MKHLIPICPVCRKRNVNAGHLLAHSTKGVSTPRKRESSARNLRRGWEAWNAKRKEQKLRELKGDKPTQIEKLA